MSKTPFCLLLRRRLSLPSLQQTLRSRHSSRRFSSLPSTPLPDPPKPSNLSARLSFVFDQIDAIERDRAQKDDALHRIRNWRDSKRAQRSQVDNESNCDTNKDENQRAESRVVDTGESIGVNSLVVAKKAVELVHPWPEWIELMERLVQQNYFDHKRRDEGKMMSDAGFDMGEDEVVEDQDFDFTKDLKTVQVACLNFGKDRFDIFRSLSRQDIQILVGYGCPTTDKKVVFSAKLLRKHVHFDEGDVCSSCSLRSSCERAYLVTNKEDEARTIDIMRVLMSFGFDHMHNTVTNKAILKQKSVKNVVRKLLHEVVKLSAVPIDPNLPPPVIKKPPPKVKQPPPPPKRRVGRDDVEMKKGDWLCTKCDFMNFAKNAVCLQCDAKRPKRQLLPGEWECPECNFLNYRRNVVCFHCECKRPHDQFMEDRLQEPLTNSRTNPDRNPRRREDVSNAWNFDFDDDESDGADVAAFEYADPTAANNDPPLEGPGGDFDFQQSTKFPKKDTQFSDFESNGRNRSGFDDFDDEDDDVDSYEVENSTRGVKSRDFEEIERDLDFEDGSDEEIVTNRRTKSREFSDSEDDDFGSKKEPSVHPDWRSSHVADSRNGGRGSLRVRSGRLSYGSDDDLEIDSGDERGNGFESRKGKSGNFSGKKGFTRINFDSDDDIPSRSPRSRFSDGSDDEISHRNSRGSRGAPRSNFRGNDSRNSKPQSRFSDGSDDEIYPRNPRGSRGALRSNFRGNDSRNSKPRSRFSDDSDDGFSSRNSRGSRGAPDRRSSFRGSDSRNSKSSGSRFSDDFGDGFSRGFRGGRERFSRGGSRGGGGSRSFRGRGDEEFGRKPRGNFGKYDQGGDAEEFKNRRRVIER